ncbi:alpha-galactosidase [Arundinibacter roseus]|uniref:Alpha-galactosidase n=1 Tax=Arundinibacter roseus TaxID=2070510 RepID=A0A4V2XAI5_9BACT|nr:alpha-galactosidase [Arundinibacter roseus]
MLFFVCTTSHAQSLSDKLKQLPIYQTFTDPQPDWLLDSQPYTARIFQDSQAKDLVLGNGLIKRRIRLSPNAATVDFQNLKTQEQFIRSLRPEARVTINGQTHAVGGLYGQREHAYFREEWLDTLRANTSDFQLIDFKITDFTPRIAWKPTTWSSSTALLKGQQVTLFFTSLQIPEVLVQVHYAVYDGMPVLSKWVTVQSIGQKPVVVDQIVHEILATPEEESAVVGSPDQMKKPQKLYVESTYAFNNAMRYELSDQATHWKRDSLYSSQVNYNYDTPCLLEVYPKGGIGQTLQPGQSIRSVESYELLLDGYDRERNGLARRRMYRSIAPWINQNPIFMHLVSTEPEQVKAVVDQCAETGYELVILSFGSGLNMEDTSAVNILKFKQLADYAHAKGIKLGGYSLFSSRRIDDATDVIDPVSGLPNKGAQFGHAPCLASQWGLDYIQKIKTFISKTGFDLLEHDGPYPGDLCASTMHAGHQGLADSRWAQMELQKELYSWLNERGVYINAPDWYFLDGTHKIAIGYREVNFSLSRQQQKILNRQNIFDGTWEKTPSMGWGFVPLTKYQGGGPEAVLEPLSEHLTDYLQLMMQYYGAGVQACYRGPRLYDTPETKATVQQVVSWYKTYRQILNADIIHLRRADGRDWDGIMHVDPNLPQKALIMLYNPLKQPITRKIRIPLYYTGLTTEARIREMDGATQTLTLNRAFEVELPVRLAAEGYSWFVVE